MASSNPSPALAGPSADPRDSYSALDDDAPNDAEAAGLLGGATLTYTPDEEAAVVRKFDRKLVLFVALLYMFSFLDRSSASLPFLSTLLCPPSFTQKTGPTPH